MSKHLLYGGGWLFGALLVAVIFIGSVGATLNRLFSIAADFSERSQTGQASGESLIEATYSLTELTPILADNGWGPIEINQSNGEDKAGDGGALSINRVTYTNGFGVHSTSVLSFNLEGKCSTFSTSYGVDDAVPLWDGSVNFHIYADGVLLHESDLMISGYSAASSGNLATDGVQELMLIVTDGNGTYFNDKANWVDPVLTCTSLPTGDEVPFRHLRGSWEPVIPWPVKAIHATLLPQGYIVSHASVDPSQIAPGDPDLPHDYTKVDLADIDSWSHEWVDHTSQEMYCAAHTLLSDGTLFEFGGHDGDSPFGSEFGKAQASTFNLETKTWAEVTHMAQARWYPTAVTLGNGDVMAIGGSNGNDNIFKPEIYDGSSWRTLSNVDYSDRLLTNDPLFDHTYPFVHLVSDGRVFWAGWDETMAYIDVEGDGAWGTRYQREDQHRAWGSPVMYEQDKLLLIGGITESNVYSLASNTAVTIDLTGETPATNLTGEMIFPRADADGTILANGEVLINGGSYYHFLGYNPTAIRAPEIWNPDTGKWTLGHMATNPRGYHSATLLLPDARVWTAGGECGVTCTLGMTAQIYNPPYLFKKDGSGELADRPTITEAPLEITYGEQFEALVNAPEGIEKITFIRYGSSTHHINFEQRIHELNFTQDGNRISLTAPSNGNLAPPGFYMLFVIDGQGVPSVAKTVQILDDGWHVVPSSDSSAPTERHETSYVEYDGNFYLMGGRYGRNTEMFDTVTRKWTDLGPPPVLFHHIQPIVFDNKIYVVGGLVGDYPSETPLSHVYIFDPADNSWSTGAEIPEERRRGSAGTVVFDNKIYMVGGNTNGHNGGFEKWFDEFDPATEQWTAKPDAPNARDHFTAVVVGNRLIATGGRQTDQPDPFDGEVEQIDVYDFGLGSWSTLTTVLPTKRAGTMAVAHGNDVIVIGGESSSQTEAHNEVQVLDLATESWSSYANLITGRHSGGAVIWNNTIYVVGGAGNRGAWPELTTQEKLRLGEPSVVPKPQATFTPTPTQTPLASETPPPTATSLPTSTPTPEPDTGGSDHLIYLPFVGIGTNR